MDFVVTIVGMNGMADIPVGGLEAAWELYRKTVAALGDFTEVELIDCQTAEVIATNDESEDW